MQCFRKLLVAKKFLEKKGGGGLSRKRNPSVLCFRNFLVAKKFEEKKLGLVSKFYVESSCLRVPKNFF